MAFLVFLILYSPIFGAALLTVKIIDQKTRDAKRKTYRVSFPADLDEKNVVSWVRSISGTLKRNSTRFSGSTTVAFEVWATNKGIVHRLKVPWAYAPYVIPQLRALVPGVVVTDEEEFPRRVWVSAVEVGLTHTARQLRIYSATDTATSLLQAMQPLEDDEAVLIQMVVTPSVPTAPPVTNEAQSHHLTYKSLLNGNMAGNDEVNDRRGKLEEPNFMAVMRVATVAKTKVRADHLVFRVKASLASTRSHSVRFSKRLVTKKELQKRIDTAAGSVMFPMQLSAPELTALMAWPVGNPFVGGLPPTISRQLPASDLVPRTGRIIGRSNFAGSERPVAMSYQDAVRHAHVLGPTGVGKSVLLANMMKQDIEQGFGVVLIENKGDLFHAAMNNIPPHRMQDVIMFDVRDAQKPVGFNLLDQGDPRIVIDELCALFDYLYRDARGVWTREALYHGLRTLITKPKMTFIDLATLLMPMTREESEWADEMRRPHDVELRQFWQRFDNQPRAAQDRFVQPVMDRIWQLTARSEIRNIIGQSESSFKMFDVVQNNKILLANMEGLAQETASLLGTLLINAHWSAVKSARPERPNFLYMDEFQDFMNLPVSAEDMLAKARSFNMGMVLAHQHLDQLKPEVKSGVLNNAATKIVFRTSSDDARIMGREFGSMVSDADFIHLGRYEAIARVGADGGVSAPLTVATAPPSKGYNSAKAVAYNSRLNYGRHVENVREQIANRHRLEDRPKRKRPDIGSSAGS